MLQKEKEIREGPPRKKKLGHPSFVEEGNDGAAR